jgi:hypothetical protein
MDLKYRWCTLLRCTLLFPSVPVGTSVAGGVEVGEGRANAGSPQGRHLGDMATLEEEGEEGGGRWGGRGRRMWGHLSWWAK